MAVGSVGMAQRFQHPVQQHYNFEVIESPNERPPRRFLPQQNIAQYIKGIQLVLTVLSTVLFSIAKYNGDCKFGDLLLSGIFGASIMFPMYLLISSQEFQATSEVFLVNFLIGTLLFMNGLKIFSMRHRMQRKIANDVEKINENVIDSEIILLIAASVSFIVAISYSVEVLLQLVDKIGEYLT